MNRIANGAVCKENSVKQTIIQPTMPPQTNPPADLHRFLERTLTRDSVSVMARNTMIDKAKIAHMAMKSKR